MALPLEPPVEPMLARSVPTIPARAGLLYEPKWDGFRALVFRDGPRVQIGSRSGKFLTRYFPDVVTAVLAQLPERCVVDGEIIIATPAGLDFPALLARVHPAASRVRLLAEQTPASLVAFDLLALADRPVYTEPFGRRRRLLEQVLATASAPVYLTPATADAGLAQVWFEQFEGAGLDGVVAKSTELPYRPGERAMFKIKHARTADCVVAGFRWHASGPVVGSLLLGLYDAAGVLQSVGVAASFTAARRCELLDALAPVRLEDGSGHPWAQAGSPGPGPASPGAAAGQSPPGAAAQRTPGGAPSRWTQGKDTSWVPVRPELVCEVGYDHLEGTRFRHTTHFLRWRPDRTPASATFAQLGQPGPTALAAVLGAPFQV